MEARKAEEIQRLKTAIKARWGDPSLPIPHGDTRLLNHEAIMTAIIEALKEMGMTVHRIPDSDEESTDDEGPRTEEYESASDDEW